jgi:cytochrome c
VRKTHILVLAVLAVVIVLAIGAVSAYGSLASDATAPVTATDVVPSYWNDVTITATATDDEGVRYVYHELDGGVVRLATVDGSPTSTQITIPTAKDSPLAAGKHELKYWAQDINGNVEAQHVVSFTLAKDSAKPETTATGATEGAWYKAAVPVHLAAADAAEGSGVKELTYSLDGASGVVIAGAAAVADVTIPATAGPHTIAYHATDVAGNVEDTKTLTVNVDTAPPVTSATAVSVIKGRTATLKYKVTETGPSAGKATVVIQVKNRKGKMVATVKPGLVAANVAATAKFTCRLSKGVYTYSVYATDLAGNAQVKAGSAKLTVK